MSPDPDDGLIARLLRRRHYRTSGPFLERFKCFVRAGGSGGPGSSDLGSNEAGSSEQSVDIADCSLGGAALVAPAGGVYQPVPNTAVGLRMIDVRTDTEHMVTGQVVRVQRDGGAHRFAVQFVDFDRLVPELDGDWWRVFNRRRVLRTAFKPKERKRVQFIGPDVSTSARLANVSVEGGGLDLPRSLVDRFERSGDCYLKVRKFPGISLPPVLAGHIRHATLVVTTTGRVARIGISWRPARTRNWITVQTALMQLVDGRMRRERAQE